MILFKKSQPLLQFLSEERAKGKKIGFVPTMGALHEGHISLLSAARQENELVVASIFVNPTQFNDPTDFQKYPITLEKDIDQLIIAGCDILFLPDVAEMYPDGTSQLPYYDLGAIETRWEGKYRPGHFQGVCVIVHRLLNIIQPHGLYMGQKDYQQCMVIQKLLQLSGLENDIQLHICPTLREENGLAMSSRNMRLSNGGKDKAGIIFQALMTIKTNLSAGNLSQLRANAQEKMEAAGFTVDYVAIAAANDLAEVHVWEGKQKLVAIVAAYLEDVRLIDNISINE